MESNRFGWVDLLYYLVAHLSSLSLVWGHYPQLKVSPGPARAMRGVIVGSFLAPNAYHYYEAAASDDR